MVVAFAAGMAWLPPDLDQRIWHAVSASASAARPRRHSPDRAGAAGLDRLPHLVARLVLGSPARHHRSRYIPPSSRRNQEIDIGFDTAAGAPRQALVPAEGRHRPSPKATRRSRLARLRMNRTSRSGRRAASPSGSPSLSRLKARCTRRNCCRHSATIMDMAGSAPISGGSSITPSARRNAGTPSCVVMRGSGRRRWTSPRPRFGCEWVSHAAASSGTRTKSCYERFVSHVPSPAPSAAKVWSRRRGVS